MAVKIRLARHGRKKKPFYRVIVTDIENPRDGRFIERLGTVDPLKDPAEINLNEERVKYWIGVGAKPSDTTATYIDRILPGYLKELEEKRREKIRSRRAKRKASQKKAA